MKFYVYALYSGASGLPFYVGQTSNLRIRMYQHRSRFGDFRPLTIQAVSSRVEAKGLEREWIELFLSLGVKLCNAALTPKRPEVSLRVLSARESHRSKKGRK
jgi:hypothetical protein